MSAGGHSVCIDADVSFGRTTALYLTSLPDTLPQLCRGTCRCVLTHTPSEGLLALQVVGRVLAEQAALFYATDAQVKSFFIVRVLKIRSVCIGTLELQFAGLASGCTVEQLTVRRPALASVLLCPTAAADGARPPQRAVFRPQPAHRLQGGGWRGWRLRCLTSAAACGLVPCSILAGATAACQTLHQLVNLRNASFLPQLAALAEFHPFLDAHPQLARSSVNCKNFMFHPLFRSWARWRSSARTGPPHCACTAKHTATCHR